MADMTDIDQAETGVQLNKGLLLASALLVGSGAVLGATGLLLGGLAVISATRQWIQQLERPPIDVARSRWQQVQAARNAATTAWQHHPQSARSLH
jgi:hypothetical protein